MTVLKIVCAWCLRDLGEKDDPSGEGGVTHGICEDCMRKYFPKVYEKEIANK